MPAPTVKSIAIEDVLTNISGNHRPTAIRNNECVWCNSQFENSYTHFRDDLSRKEYSISGMCQACQDKVYGEADE